MTELEQVNEFDSTCKEGRIEVGCNQKELSVQFSSNGKNTKARITIHFGF